MSDHDSLVEGRCWIIRDDVPAAECKCLMPLLAAHFPHSSWCPAVRQPGGAFYYAGRDLQGHWWMSLADAAAFGYRDAQQMIRGLSHPRKLTLERQEAERLVA